MNKASLQVFLRLSALCLSLMCWSFTGLYASTSENMPSTSKTSTCYISISTGSGTITVDGLSGHATIQIFDAHWQSVYHCNSGCAPSKTVDHLPAGQYFVSAKIYDDSWRIVCVEEQYVDVNGGGNGGDDDDDDGNGGDDDDDDGNGGDDDDDDGNGGDDDDDDGNGGDDDDDDGNGGDDDDDDGNGGDDDDDDGNGGDDDDDDGNGGDDDDDDGNGGDDDDDDGNGGDDDDDDDGNTGGGCTDEDHDGVCAADDCDDHNPNLPTTPGTACNDGNASTTNDLIQADGCSCAGIPTQNCNINITVGQGAILVSGLDGVNNTVQVFDAGWRGVFTCNSNCGPTLTVDNIASGRYYVSTKTYDASWVLLCVEEIYVDVTGSSCTDVDGDGVCAIDDCDDNNPHLPLPVGTSCNDGDTTTINDVIQADGCSCAGTPTQNCNISITTSNGSISVSGLTGAYTSIQIFDTQWQGVFTCTDNCAPGKTINNLPAGTYFVSAKIYDNAYRLICVEEQYVHVPGNPGGGDDDDDDGNGGDDDDDDGNGGDDDDDDGNGGDDDDDDGNGGDDDDDDGNGGDDDDDDGNGGDDDDDDGNGGDDDDDDGNGGDDDDDDGNGGDDDDDDGNGGDDDDDDGNGGDDDDDDGNGGDDDDDDGNGGDDDDDDGNGGDDCDGCNSTVSATFNGCDRCVDVSSCKDLSNVVLLLCDGTEYKFDNLNQGHSGRFCSPDGQNILGVWIKAGCNASGDGPGYGAFIGGPCTSGNCGGGCTDNDGDGVCAQDDCNDHDASIPATPGTSCDDRNAATTNDVIQADGCTCAGTPTQNCNISITATAGQGSITVSGLNGANNTILVFDAAWRTVFSCNTNCGPSKTIDGLASGSYFVSAKSYDGVWSLTCVKELTVQVTGGSCTDHDGDGVCAQDDCDDNNPSLPVAPGTLCNDGDTATVNDVILGDGCTCAGTPSQDCDIDIVVSADQSEVIVTGLSGVAGGFSTIQVFDVNWQEVFSCSDCGDAKTISGLASGSYYVIARIYNSSWRLVCEEQATVNIVGGPGICADRDVSNTHRCGSGADYGGYLQIQGENSHYTVSNGSFVEFTDGTARLTALWTNQGDDRIRFEVDVLFSGRTTHAPSGSPKDHVCRHPNTGDFYYYTSTSGQLRGQGKVAGAVIEVSRRGEAFQLGKGANVTHDGLQFGASGWLDLRITQQPNGSYHLQLNDGSTGDGDINIQLSGDHLACIDGSSRASEQLAFEAFQSGREIELNWATNTGYKNNFFIIQRSADEVSYVDLKEVSSLYSDEEMHAYSDVDEDPIIGMNYYRLVKVHLDGSQEIIDARAIQFGVNLHEFGVFPNPATKEINVNLRPFTGKSGVVQIYDQLGRKLAEQSFDQIPDQLVGFDVHEYKEGMYNVTVKVDGFRRMTERVIVIRPE